MRGTGGWGTRSNPSSWRKPPQPRGPPRSSPSAPSSWVLPLPAHSPNTAHIVQSSPLHLSPSGCTLRPAPIILPLLTELRHPFTGQPVCHPLVLSVAWEIESHSPCLPKWESSASPSSVAILNAGAEFCERFTFIG